MLWTSLENIRLFTSDDCMPIDACGTFRNTEFDAFFFENDVVVAGMRICDRTGLYPNDTYTIRRVSSL
jgi:hypothetical protein